MRKILSFLESIKIWQLLTLVLISLIVSVFALRANNEHMNTLRNAVYTADKNNTNVQQALDTLQSYVIANMNTSLSGGPNSIYPPIQLVYTYQRLVSKLGSQSSAANSHIYTDAEYYCQQKIPVGFSGRYRVPCIEQYITSHNLSAPNIPQSLYEFDFISPSWSPDLAGWSILVTGLLGIFVLIKLILLGWNKYFN